MSRDAATLQITEQEATVLRYLLVELQTHLESAIESSLTPGENLLAFLLASSFKPNCTMTEMEGRAIQRDRRMWRRSEILGIMLESRIAGCEGPLNPARGRL